MIGDLGDLPRGRGAVRVTVDGALATVTIDNPEARNAISPGMMVDLVAIVARLEAEPVAAVLVHGAGDQAFCAGGDLHAVSRHLMDPDAAATMCAVMGDALDRFSQIHAVVVAAVEGAAIGGGAELMSACDVVFAGATAQVGFVHASLGVSPGWGGAGRLVRRVGPRHALTVLAGGGRMTAQMAAEHGLVDHVVPQGTALDAARAWCVEVCGHPVAAVRGAVRTVRTWRDRPADGVATERAVFGELWGGEAHVAALAKVFDK